MCILRPYFIATTFIQKKGIVINRLGGYIFPNFSHETCTRFVLLFKTMIGRTIENIFLFFSLMSMFIYTLILVLHHFEVFTILILFMCSLICSLFSSFDRIFLIKSIVLQVYKWLTYLKAFLGN